MEIMRFLEKNYLVDKRSEQRSEGTARVSSSKVIQCRECSHKFHFNNSEGKTV